MLSVQDLIDINYIPDENDISLQLLVDFYEQYLCKRIFIFKLKNNKIVKLFFRDPSEIFHISGIDHIYDDVPMDGKRFLQGIKNGNIDLTAVEKVNSPAYKDYITRICSMACIDTIIKKCEYLWYPDGKIPDSTIQVKYLLLKGLDGKNLHLGIDTYKENRPYFSRTLLVTEGNTAEKFIGKADERLRVTKLEIRDKDNNDLLVCVEREKAEQIADAEVAATVDKWMNDELSTIIAQHIKNKVKEQKLEDWLSLINYYVIDCVGTVDEDIDTVLKMRDECAEFKEWISLMNDVLLEKLSDIQWLLTVLLPIMENDTKYDELLRNCIRRSDKDIWKTELRRTMDSQKIQIQKKVATYDSYWAGKITAEAIRSFDKNVTNGLLDAHIENHILRKGKLQVQEVLADKITKEKQFVVEHIKEILK